MTRWMLWTPQILETADNMSREQLVEQLVAQKVLHGAADAFILEPIEEILLGDKCSAPNGAAGEESEELDATRITAEK